MSVPTRPDWPEIWFLRHGETEWNLQGRIQGHQDSPLTTRGCAHARQQAGIIRNIAQQVAAANTGGLYVSPLGRARQTAALALPEHCPLVDPRLAEIATGAWEGMLKTDLPQGANDLAVYSNAPQGEGLDALIARVRSFADDLTGPSIVVSHGLWGQVLRGLAEGLTPETMGCQSNLQGCVYHIRDGQVTCLEPEGDG
ncbi:histidine phosphatase family protein [Rhodobacteraceae bacterium KMM 6894]|nr:histidine phosphatase family protein [Rhodobacteraceae bacterium KMM 6894]